ncbi:MAG: DUF4179 domain-containing protein [Armatimonadetes bacterium]|nr:DUF4179 domain-containing protein [Anaerolineae bacterium]
MPKSMVLVVLLSALLLGGAAITSSQETYVPPPDIFERLEAAGLTIPLEISQTIDGVTVTVRYAYADASSLIFDYSVTVLDENGVAQPMRSPEGNTPGGYNTPFQYRLRDATGLFELSQPRRFNNATFRGEYSSQLQFYLPSDLLLPTTLDLTLDLVINQLPQPFRPFYVYDSFPRIIAHYMRVLSILDIGATLNQLPEAVVWLTREGVRPAILTLSVDSTGAIGSAVFSSGIGGSNIIYSPEATAEPAPLTVPPSGVGQFSYTFSVPVLPAVTATPMTEIPVNGIPMTLEFVRVSPTLTEATGCWLRDQEAMWEFADVTLTLNDTSYDHASYSSYGGGKKNPRQCFTFTFDAFMPTLPSSATLRIGALQDIGALLTDEAAWQAFVAIAVARPELADIEPEQYEGYGILYFEPRLKPLLVELGYRVEGDWSWTVELE